MIKFRFSKLFASVLSIVALTCAISASAEDGTCTMYAADGRTISVDIKDVEAYKSVGWYTEPMTTLYSLDGNTLIIESSRAEAQQEVGWYTAPVAMLYAADGRTLVVNKSDVEAYKQVNWYETYMDAVAHRYPDSNVKIFKTGLYMNSVGGVEPRIDIRNDSGKTISNLRFTVTPYNNAGMPQSCTVTKNQTRVIEITTPVLPFEAPEYYQHFYYAGSSRPLCTDAADAASYYVTDDAGKFHYLNATDYKYTADRYYWNEVVWYNSNITHFIISKIEIIYTDGTAEIIYNPPVYENLFRSLGL